MGSLTETTPKSLLDVQGRPILWYIILQLYKSGVRRLVLPIGYLGDQISDYVGSEFGALDCEIFCVDTGVDTPIGLRLNQIRDYLPKDGSIFLTNGDAVFDLDVSAMAKVHQGADAAATFATVETISQYGLLVMDDNGVAGFERRSHVAGYQIQTENGLSIGLVYAGICMLHNRSLDRVDLATSPNFEAELFPKLIAEEKTAQYVVPGFWYSIDTPKDLANISTGDSTDPLIAVPATRLKEDLEKVSVA